MNYKIIIIVKTKQKKKKKTKQNKMDFSFSPITVTRFDEACVTSLETCFFGFFFSISMRGNSQTIYTVRNNHTSKRDKVESFWLSMSDHKICCLHYNCRFHFFKFLRTSFFEQEWPVMWIVDCTSICYAYKKNVLGSRQPNHFTPVHMYNSADSAWRNSSRHRKDTAAAWVAWHIGTIVRI